MSCCRALNIWWPVLRNLITGEEREQYNQSIWCIWFWKIRLSLVKFLTIFNGLKVPTLTSRNWVGISTLFQQLKWDSLNCFLVVDIFDTIYSCVHLLMALVAKFTTKYASFAKYKNNSMLLLKISFLLNLSTRDIDIHCVAGRRCWKTGPSFTNLNV